MTEAWSTATFAVETPRGTRYQGVVFAGPVWPAWKGMRASRRLPNGAQVRYRTRLFKHLSIAFEEARRRTIHWNLYHGDDAVPHTYRCTLPGGKPSCSTPTTAARPGARGATRRRHELG